ncbi:response regulator transcription factor [bacterium]|nr:response regulator transcription factor [bacterium]
MTNGRILIIDDDEKLNALLREYLGQFGYETESVLSPGEGLQRIRRQCPDLVILDVMLPDMDGFEVCREIRKDCHVPVIMLTARGDVTDRIVGLEMGADDYLPKPFEPRELVARIQAILRRQASRDDVVRVGGLIVNMDQQTVILKGEPVLLTTLEFNLLAVFIRYRGRVLSRDRIMDALRGLEWSAFDRSVDVLISRLRHKLNDDPRNPHWIRTIHGSGYKFIGDDDEPVS